MPVENPGIIDAISIVPNGDLELTISDHLVWDDRNEHLVILQEKIKAYLGFIESGEIYEKNPKALGRRFLIWVVMKFPLGDDGEEFLNRIGTLLHESGHDFGYKYLPE